MTSAMQKRPSVMNKSPAEVWGLELPDVFRCIAKSALVASQRQRYACDNLARDFQRARQSLGRDSHGDDEACNREWKYSKAAPK